MSRIQIAGALVITEGTPTSGTAKTIALAKKHRKSWLVVDLANDPSPDNMSGWLKGKKIQFLNVAGPRESKCPGIHGRALEFLRMVFEASTNE